MNLDETQEETRFRSDVRRYLDESIEDDWRGSESFSKRLEADRALAAGGYLGYLWPRKYGGQAGTPICAAILDEERGRAGIPASQSPSRFGVNLLGPTLIAHGTSRQCEEFLAPILQAEAIWCQGFSEPDAGSDLAAVQCVARPDGDVWRIDGAKIWTTQGPEADWCFALVRTGERADRHRNLSFVLIEMNQPGVEIRSLVQSTGASDFSQVFFDGARVYPKHVVGDINDGWRVAMTTLGAERAFGQLSRFGQYMLQLGKIADIIRNSDHPQRDAWMTEFGFVLADVSGIRNLSYRIASLAEAGEDPGSLPSVTKLWWSTSHQRLVDLGYTVSAATSSHLDYWFPLWLESRGETIYAGASQIQRNIISERMLGLPR